MVSYWLGGGQFTTGTTDGPRWQPLTTFPSHQERCRIMYVVKRRCTRPTSSLSLPREYMSQHHTTTTHHQWNGQWATSQGSLRESSKGPTKPYLRRSKDDGQLRTQNGSQPGNLLHQIPGPKRPTFRHNSTRCRKASSCLNHQTSILKRPRTCGTRYLKRSRHLQPLQK